MNTKFKKLNHDWNADPNDPDPILALDGTRLRLTFYRNHFIDDDVYEGATMSIEFEGVSKYRLGRTNDEGWYKGQCRFSKAAPEWGEFYEITGETIDEFFDENEWKTIARRSGLRLFLFYFRDATFECDAESYQVIF